MLRSICWSLTLVLGTAGQLFADGWADKMFAERTHDFGPVPRAAKIEYSFPIKNVYKEDVHIAAVRSSCGCTLPRIEKDTLKTHEQGSIIAEFNTRGFFGQHGAHVTVVIDRPQYAEVHLDVKGYIRTDVVVDPGQVNFGTVEEGSAAERKITVEFAGRQDWKVLEVKPGSSAVTAQLKEVRRDAGRVSYELDVKLADTAPAGYLRDQLTLVTNDKRAPELAVVVEGRVTPELMVSPSSLMLGILQPGQTVTKQLVIRAKRPFRITSLQAGDAKFSYKLAADEAKPVHVVPVTFTADEQPGKIARRVRVETDLGAHGTAEIEVLGEVVAPLAGK
jgi:Protein of unknown function (DUF1573)